MEQNYDRALTLSERLEKTRKLLEAALLDFEASETAEDELGVRRRASESSEKAFHALIVLADGLLSEHGLEANNHDDRIEKLEDIDRRDLVAIYERAMNALHISGYYGQRIGRRQRDVLKEVALVIRRGLERLE